MDDLARIALRALDRGRATVRAHPSISLGAGGFLAATVTMIAGGRIGPPGSVIPITSWLGLMSRNGGQSSLVPGSFMLAGVAVLLVLWLVAIRIHHAGSISEAGVWGICAAWTVPFAVGPPLLSNDVFTYAAQGLMLRAGLDPYSVGPSALGNVRAVQAVDPSWRSVPSPYGPLATTVQHLAAAISGGNPLGAALVFRAVGVVALVAIGLLAAEIAGPRRRVQALTITVLNPLVLLHVVSAAHLDGLMCVLLLGAVVAANQRRWALAIVLAVAAGAVKAPAFIAVVAIIAVHVQAYRGRRAWEVGARDSLIAAVGTFGVSLIVKNGWGWIHGLNAPALGHTALAPASLISDIFKPVVQAASFDDLAAGGRITALAAAGCISLYLVATARSRALNRTVGYGMLAIGVLSPVVYPWYLLGGIVALAPTARDARRDWIVLLSAAGCLLSPAGFGGRVSTELSIASIVVSLGVIAPRILERRRRARAVVPPPLAPRVSAGG